MKIFVCTNRKYDSFLKNKKCKIFTSLNDCIKQKPDVAFITNTTNLHVKTAIKLANANIHIFIEKPLSNSTREIKLLLDIVKKRKLVTMMGCVLRFHPAIKKIKQITSGKKIGEIISVHAENGSFLPDWHLNEDYKKSYASQKKLGGGVCLTNIHEIDLMIDLFGNAKLLKSHSDKVSNLKINVEDFSISLYKNFLFNKKLISLIILDFFQINKERYIKIIYDKGEIFLDLNNNFLKIIEKKKVRTFNFVKEKNLMYMKELNFFLNLFKKRKKIPDQYNEKNALKSLKLALRIKSNHK